MTMLNRRGGFQTRPLFRYRHIHPTLAAPLPPSYEEGAKKVCAAMRRNFYKGGAKRRNLIPLDPFFGKRGAAAAAGYSSPRPPS